MRIYSLKKHFCFETRSCIHYLCSVPGLYKVIVGSLMRTECLRLCVWTLSWPWLITVMVNRQQYWFVFFHGSHEKKKNHLRSIEKTGAVHLLVTTFNLTFYSCCFFLSVKYFFNVYWGKKLLIYVYALFYLNIFQTEHFVCLVHNSEKVKLTGKHWVAWVEL